MAYNPALDGLRAFAVLAVMLFHARAPGWGGGFLGVDIFFVLSGFLITTLLLRERRETGGVNIGRFIKRRLMRLAPAAIAMCAAFVVTAHFALPDVNALKQAAIAMVYLADYSVALFGIPRHISHMWSLSVEMHFYIVWPLVIPILGRVRWLGPSTILAVLYIFATLWRLVATVALDWDSAYYRFDTRVSGLVLGGWLASVMSAPDGAALPRRMAPAVWLAVPLMLVVIFLSQWRGDGSLAFGVMAVEWCTAVVLLACYQPGNPLKTVLSWPALVWLGQISYGLYLWHYPIFWYLRREGQSWLLTLGVGIPLSLALAAVSWRFIERKWRSQS